MLSHGTKVSRGSSDPQCGEGNLMGLAAHVSTAAPPPNPGSLLRCQTLLDADSRETEGKPALKKSQRKETTVSSGAQRHSEHTTKDSDSLIQFIFTLCYCLRGSGGLSLLSYPFTGQLRAGNTSNKPFHVKITSRGVKRRPA